jgi:Tfp pilus assembly protein PilO
MTTKTVKKTKVKAPKKAKAETISEYEDLQTKIAEITYHVDKLEKAIPSRKFYIIVIVILVVLFLMSCFFCRAPITGQSELTMWTKQQAQTIPSEYRKEIKAIMRESYQSTAEAIQSRQIVTTSDARTRLSQLLQAKILSLNRLTRNPQELETITQAMKPISDAIGDRLASDVDAGKMKDTLENVQKAFNDIANGFK